jgi:hypothetical protein
MFMLTIAVMPLLHRCADLVLPVLDLAASGTDCGKAKEDEQPTSLLDVVFS